MRSESAAAPNPSRSVFVASHPGTMFRPHWQQAEIAISCSRRTRRVTPRIIELHDAARGRHEDDSGNTQLDRLFHQPVELVSAATQACTSVIASGDSRSIARCRPRTTRGALHRAMRKSTAVFAAAPVEERHRRAVAQPQHANCVVGNRVRQFGFRLWREDRRRRKSGTRRSAERFGAAHQKRGRLAPASCL